MFLGPIILFKEPNKQCVIVPRCLFQTCLPFLTIDLENFFDSISLVLTDKTFLTINSISVTEP